MDVGNKSRYKRKLYLSMDIVVRFYQNLLFSLSKSCGRASFSRKREFDFCMCCAISNVQNMCKYTQSQQVIQWQSVKVRIHRDLQLISCKNQPKTTYKMVTKLNEGVVN